MNPPVWDVHWPLMCETTLPLACRFRGHELSENFGVGSYCQIKTYLTSRRPFFTFLAAAKKGGGAENNPKRYATFEPAPRLNK